MDNVIKQIISKKKRVSSFVSKKAFIDIGNKETYEETSWNLLQQFKTSNSPRKILQWQGKLN